MNTDLRDYIFKASHHKDAQARSDKIALQEKLQRFVGRFEDRVGQASYFLEQKFKSKTYLIIRQQLVYFSSAIEIATGPSPGVNLLDMLTFIRLSGDRVESYWMKEHYHDEGKELLKIFRTSESELWEIAQRYTTSAQRTMILRAWEDWKKANPELVLVERVRLSAAGGIRQEEELHKLEGMSGVLKSMKEALSTADETYLLGNRALFYSQRLPTLIRLESRLASMQILEDSLSTVARSKELRPFVGDITELVRSSKQMVAELNSIMPDQKREVFGDLLRLAKSFESRLSNSGMKFEQLISHVKTQINSIVWNCAIALMCLIAFAFMAYWTFKNTMN